MAGRLASWTEDKDKKEIPELLLNRLLVAEVFLQMLALGLGTIALVWATVVLLGGFSSALMTMDFWFVTAIVFVETARIVGYNSAPEAKFFVDVPAAFLRRKTLQVGSATAGFVGLITMGPALVAVTPIFAASACMTLSIWRLQISIGSHGYAGSNAPSGNGNLLPALILFYALVLTQGALFLMWLVVAMSRSAQAENLYFTGEEKKITTDRYIARTLDICVEKGVVSTMNRTLVTFAEELLQSEQDNDHEDAVLVLHNVIKREERRDGATKQICSSEQLVCRLIRLLSSKSPYKLDTRIHAAEIVKDISKNLYLANIPGAANSLSSLLDARFMTKAAQTSHNTGEIVVSIKRDMSSLIVHSLQILCKLAEDPGNCTEMYNTKDLVSKIIASLTHGLHVAVVNNNEDATVEIVRESLGVLAKLTSGTGESSTELCWYLLDNSTTVVGHMLFILRNSSHTDLKIQAVKMLTSLTLGRRLPKERKGLVLGRVECPDLQQMVTILTNDEISKEDRAVTARLLAELCANSGSAHDRNRMRPISSALSTVLKVIGNTQCTNDVDADTWKVLGGLLDLTVQICVNLAIPADAFAAAVKGIPEEDHVFVNKLKEIVDTCMDRFSRNRSKGSEDIVCLMTMKAAAKFATWIMEINCHYIECFCQVNFLEKLDTSIIDMANLEKYMILTGCRDESERYETLSSLVTRAKDLVSRQEA
ncbi:unnamed protein product [Miscanthus lutarioriparius]|uniref:Uncharacterized protein n=1 Tax=Miscanthus lutarioriparius TaxID=422564 RepID=A0A811R9V8_9POAL|nr:unnamed protein product [Miscanthus lutarioriparius]